MATKEATGNILRAQELKRALGDRLTVLSGDDGLTLGMMAVGGAGVISVTSNLYPDKVSEVVRLAASNRWAHALRAHQRLLPVHDAILIESDVADIDTSIDTAQQAMSDASSLVLDGFRLRSDAKKIIYPDRYQEHLI